jgi:hypothetical protein
MSFSAQPQLELAFQQNGLVVHIQKVTIALPPLYASWVHVSCDFQKKLRGSGY